MNWSVKVNDKIKKKLAKLDPQNRDRIVDFLVNTLPNLNNPRQLGQALQGNLQGYWRYRVGDYRILCEIIDNQMVIYAIEVGHRREVYRYIIIVPMLCAHCYTQVCKSPSYPPGSRYPVPGMVSSIHPCSLDSGNPCRNDGFEKTYIMMSAGAWGLYSINGSPHI